MVEILTITLYLALIIFIGLMIVIKFRECFVNPDFYCGSARYLAKDESKDSEYLHTYNDFVVKGFGRKRAAKKALKKLKVNSYADRKRL